MKQFRELMARPFELVTCPDGHPCFLTIKSMYYGNVLKDENFIALDGAVFKRMYTTCPVCGSWVFRLFRAGKRGNSGQFHVRGKLRTIEELKDAKTEESSR